MQKLILVFSLLGWWASAASQPVSFILKNDVLHPVSGFTLYSDCAVDMNGDQLDDIVRVGNKGMYIDYQHPDGQYTQSFFPMPVQSPPSWSICAGDIDNNGLNELLFGHTTSVSFVKADSSGNGYHETVMSPLILSQRSTMADINNDGWLDAFVCNDTAQSIPFRNTGHGDMVPDTNLIHTADRPGSYAAIWTDYDNDGDVDLYISKCQTVAPPGHINRTNLLYRNNGDGSFTDVAAQAGLDDNAQSWSTVFEDFDNDGDFDAFIVNHDFQNRLFRNNGDATFTDVITTSGINAADLGAFENTSGDFNNDGFIDIFSDLTTRLYLGHGDLTFTAQDAPTIPGAVADLNQDGFLDVFHFGQMWLNEGNTHHWLKVFPIGITSNRNGIGARVEIYGAWGTQVREVRSGQGYSPMNSLTVHFGLGMHTEIDSLIIRWPSGVVSILRELQADSTYVVPEAPCFLPAGNIQVIGDQALCAGDTTLLLVPQGFTRYRWSTNDTSQVLEVGSKGTFYVICIDSIGCASMTPPLDISQVTEYPPQIYSPAGNTICEGDSLLLISSPGENYTWSDGSLDAQIVSVSESGMYTVAIDALCFDGQLLSDPFQVNVLPSPPPLVNDAVILPGDSILLTADGENCEWYDQSSGGNLLAEGLTFQTMPLTSSTTYYVESHHLYPGENQSGGKPDTTGGGGLALQAGYLVFETWEPFTLVSVTAYVPAGGVLGTRFVQLWSGDSLLAFKSFVVQQGTNIFELNFKVPAGKFTLQCKQGNLWRNSGPLDYPYPIGDVGRITSSSFGDQYYYFFYDWKIKKEDYECISDRTAVQVILSGVEVPVHSPVLTIFPNPTSGLLFVELKGNAEGAKRSALVDALGREIWSQKIDPRHSFQLDLNPIPAGIYSLQVWGDGFYESCKLIKN